MDADGHDADTVLRFWFDELEPAQWWAVDAALDETIRERFGATLHAAHAGECHRWRATRDGRLAEIVVLDQFSRNIHRGHARAFAADPMALALAQEAVAAGADRVLAAERVPFLLMPYMHSESRAIHAEALLLFDRPGLENNLDFERRHKAIIDRFGRYPHRNAVLGRESTADELAFLQTPGSSF